MSNRQYAIRDRDGNLHPEQDRKSAQRSQRAYGGMLVATKNGNGDWQPYKRKRIFLWVFLGIQALFIIWLITGLASIHTGVSPHAAEVVKFCKNGGWQALYKSYQDCLTSYAHDLTNAGNTGKGLGAAAVVLIWVVVDFFLGLGYGIYRLARR